MTARINVFDQDTLDYLRAKGIEGELLQRVRLTMQECADYHARYDDPTPKPTSGYQHKVCPWCGEGKDVDHAGCAVEYQDRYGVALPTITLYD